MHTHSQQICTVWHYDMQVGLYLFLKFINVLLFILTIPYYSRVRLHFKQESSIFLCVCENVNYQSIHLSFSVEGAVLYSWWDVEFTKRSLLKRYLKLEPLVYERKLSGLYCK